MDVKAIMFGPTLVAKLRRDILSRDDSRDPAQSYIAFRGRLPNADALRKDRGVK